RPRNDRHVAARRRMEVPLVGRVDGSDRRSRRAGHEDQLLVSADVQLAAEMLRHGQLVAFPTETVYGLGADARNASAVKRLYAVKGRPADHPVIVHVARAEKLDAIARDVPDAARALAADNWPGPLTLIVKRRAGVIVDEVTGGR